MSNYISDKVNHDGRLCELISIAYLIKVSGWRVHVCACKSFVRSTAGGLI